MPAKKDPTIRKTKRMSCGHEQTFSTPVPRYGDNVWCLTCEIMTTIPKKVYPPGFWTVAEGGRPRRLKSNPRSNNQYTKGRKLNNGA
jgi:hypothetical protein